MSDNQNNRISFRVQVSVLLLAFALLAWILPDRQRSAGELTPAEMVSELIEGPKFLPVDQIARSVVNEDNSIQLVDIRPPAEYLSANIPGSINIPFEDILNPDWSGYFDDPERFAVVYANGNTLAAEAWTLCTQVGYPGVKIMEGGMNEWFDLVMNSEFQGERISAAENARFEMRYRARDYFISMNSLPDSLKTAYLLVKQKKEAELVGGCE
jgi:rhodanese-related sulfurtransferase